MAAKDIMAASETGLAAVAGSVAKAHQTLPDNVRDAADRRLGAESPLGKGVLSVVDTIAEEAAKARLAGSAAAAEIAAVREMDTDELTEKVAALGEKAKKRVSRLQLPGKSKKKSRMPGTKVVLGAVVLAAAAGGAVLAWRRKSAAEALAAEDEQSGFTPAEDSILDDRDDEELAPAADELGTPSGEPLDMDLGDVPTEVAQAPAPFGGEAEGEQSDAQSKPESGTAG